MNTTAYRLIIDTRESAVSCHKDVFAATTTEIAQITVGDYAVLAEDKIVAVFERKTYQDYGASLKDGRHQNKDKILNLRQKTGCRLFYIIEGRAIEGCSYGGIPYEHIRSSIIHLQLRDGISMIYTTDTYDTARTLCEFVEGCKTAQGDWWTPIVTCEWCAPEPPILITAGSERTLLFEVHAKDDATTLRSMWAKFRGITVATAHSFMTKWSIYDAMRGIDATQVGHKVTKMVIASTSRPDEHTIAKIFSVIPKISAKTAPKYARLFKDSPAAFAFVDTLRELKLPGGFKKDGVTRTPDKKIGKMADLIHRLIHLRVPK